MTRHHLFATGLTICMFVWFLCTWGMHYSLGLGMIGVGLGTLLFYPGALLLAMAFWPPETKY